MIYRVISRLLFLTFVLSVSQLHAQVTFSTKELSLLVSAKGQVDQISIGSNGKNILAKDTTAPFITLVSNRKRYMPTTLQYSKATNTITFKFQPAGVAIQVRVIQKPTYFVFEVIKAEPENAIDAIVWGPIPTTITETVGEVIGVVRDNETAVGMFVLNTKTLGGDLPNSEGSTWSRGIAAKSYPAYSSLQAYSINRNRVRNVDAWGGEFKNMSVAPIKGETVVGSKIALFACATSSALDRLEAISIAEKLPYPTYKKTWFKKSALFGKSYLISSFGEQDMDEMIAYTKRAGLYSLYHEGPFMSWGHYIFDSTSFPKGKESIKNCVQKAHAAGLLFGVHTLTNFINTNDPYITPVPDERLSMTGASILMMNIDAQQKEIEVASPEYFNQERNNNLHTVKIGKELIRYKSVSSTRPYKLLDCQRGAFGTAASSHANGDVVGKLMDHAYQVFFPNFDLQREIAKNLAGIFNETGIDHFDLDGHEGCLASGQGDYGLEVFAKDVFDNIDHEMIFGTSNSKTYYWNIGSYYNWGEPWYGGFKESMQQYRIDNQGLFSRNYMPHMLGWYLLAEHTTLPEMEWMLARAAGYNAGFAMVARPNALRKNPLTPQLLDAIREWETARTTNAFTSSQQELLKNPANEFHLEKLGEGKWNLYQYALSPLFVREKFERQPGEPTHTTWKYSREETGQPLQFRLVVAGKSGAVNNIRMQIDNYTEIKLSLELKAGESLVCDGTKEVRLYGTDGKPKGFYQLKDMPPALDKGDHTIIFDCNYPETEAPKVEVQFRSLGKVERVGSL